MTEPTAVDARIAAFFATPQADLPDRAFDAVRRDIHAARQRRVLVGQWRFALRVGVAAVGAVAVLAIVAFGIASLPTTGPGSSPSQQANPTSSALLSPAVPTHYTSTLYGYTLTLPAGWSITPASQAWDGRVAPGFGGLDVDAYTGPGRLAALSYAGPFAGDLQAFVADRIAANVRDHSDTCPPGALQVNEPMDVGGQAGVLLGWNCGALINEALTVRNGVAYAFGFRDLGIKAARDPTDLATLQRILDSVALPAPPAPSSSIPRP